MSSRILGEKGRRIFYELNCFNGVYLPSSFGNRRLCKHCFKIELIDEKIYDIFYGGVMAMVNKLCRLKDV